MILGAAASLVVTAAVAAGTGHHAALPTIAALALAPAGAIATAYAARRVAGNRFAGAAALVYAFLPVIGLAYCLSTYRHSFLHEAVPGLVGLRRPGLLAVGVAAVAAIAVTPRVLVAPTGAVAAAVALAVWGVHPLTDVRNGLHETAWSIALAEWAAVAGVLGVARRAPLLAAGAGGWLVFSVLRAASHGYDDAAFWRQLGPGVPVIALCLTSVALLVPSLRPARRPLDAH